MSERREEVHIGRLGVTLLSRDVLPLLLVLMLGLGFYVGFENMGDTRSAEHTRLTRQIAHLEDQITQYNAKLVEELHLIAVLISIPEAQRPRLLLPEGLKERLPSPFPPTQHKE